MQLDYKDRKVHLTNFEKKEQQLLDQPFQNSTPYIENNVDLDQLVSSEVKKQVDQYL